MHICLLPKYLRVTLVCLLDPNDVTNLKLTSKKMWKLFSGKEYVLQLNIGKLSFIERLKLKTNKLISKILSFPNLKELVLEELLQNYSVIPIYLSKVFDSIKNDLVLRKLILPNGNYNLTGSCRVILKKDYSQLEELQLPIIPDEYTQFLSEMKELRVFKAAQSGVSCVSSLPKISEIHLQDNSYFMQHPFPDSLRVLKVNGTVQWYSQPHAHINSPCNLEEAVGFFTESSLHNLSKARKLKLTRVEGSVEGLTGCEELEEVSLNFVDMEVNFEVIKKMILCLPKLSKLKLSNCYASNNSNGDELKKKIQQLVLLASEKKIQFDYFFRGIMLPVSPATKGVTTIFFFIHLLEFNFVFGRRREDSIGCRFRS